MKPQFINPDVHSVPCNGCTLCCHNDAIRLLPGDDPDQYETQPHHYMPGQLMLKHKPNGDCIYLGESGCSIHDRRPRMCKRMDCRTIARVFTWTQVRKMERRNAIKMAVWQRGKELLKNA